MDLTISVALIGVGGAIVGALAGAAITAGVMIWQTRVADRGRLTDLSAEVLATAAELKIAMGGPTEYEPAEHPS
jgi:hypothetical protein